MKMHTVAKKPAPPAPCSLPAAQEPDEMSVGLSPTAAAASAPEDQELTIYLPDGRTAVVFINPSKPMMDLQIKICGQLRLSPAEYSLQVFTGESSWPVAYKANQTLSSLGVSTVKLVSKKLEKDKLKSSTQQPFEITQRLIVSLPNNQKYVMRVKPEILLSELFQLATAHKGLDPLNYKLCHPLNPDLILNMDSPLSVYGISEICLVNEACSKVTYYSADQSFKSDMHGTARPTSINSGNQSSVQESQTKAMTTVTRNQSTTSKHQTMLKSTSVPGPETSGFMPSTSFEKKKGFLSFLKRKKSGKFSFGGSMQNLHQIDPGSPATLSKQKLSTPMNSELQLHRNSPHTSSTQTLASPSQQARTMATASQLQLQIPAASKKRPAPQPPGVLLPLTTDSGTGRLVRPSPRLPSVSHPLTTTRTGLEDSVRQAPQIPCSTPPSQGTGDVAVQLSNGIGHSPSSSQSSGFEEMSPSPLDEASKPTFSVAGAADKSDSAVLNLNGGVRESGAGESKPSAVLGSDLDFSLLQKAGKPKRKAPPPPGVAMPVYSGTASSDKPTPPSSVSSDSGSSSFLHDGTLVGSPGLNSLSSSRLSRDETLRQKSTEANDECIGNSNSFRTASSGTDGVGARNGNLMETDTSSLESGKDARETGLPCGANALDDEDADALAAEAEDCFCEQDIGYDGEIVFDCEDFTFVAPEVKRANASVAAASSKRSVISDQREKTVIESHNADSFPTEKLNMKAVKVDNTYQLPGVLLESKAADVLRTESNKEIIQKNLKPTEDERKALKPSDSCVNREDPSNRVAVINDQFLEKRDCLTNDFDKKLLSEDRISVEWSQTMNLNSVSGSNCLRESTELNSQASTEGTLNCSASAVFPVASEIRSGTIATTPSLFPDKTLENDYRRSSASVDDPALTSLLQQNGETSWEPRTIIINKSHAVPMCIAPEVHQTNSVRNSLDPPTTEENEFESHITVARGERTVQTSSQLSIETRDKLSSDSFLVDRSLCSRFYPSMNPPLSDTVNANALSCVDTSEDRQAFVNKESTQIKSDVVTSTSRSSDSKSEYIPRQSLYHLVRHSPPAATDDFDSCRKTVESKDSKPVLNVSEQQTFRATEKAEKHSSNVPFAVELQRHLSRWHQQHPKSTDSLPQKSAPVTCDPDGNSTKEVKDRKSSISSTIGPSSPPATGGSLAMATGSNTRLTVANNGSSSSAVANNNKGLNKSEVVFTMEQLLNAKSSLRRTATSENSSSEVSQSKAFGSIQNPQSSVKENRNSSRSVTSTTVSSVKGPMSPETSDGRVCSTENNIPKPPSLPPLVGNHVEKKTGPSGRMTEGNRNTLAKKPQQEMNFRDDLLTAIRNAGGKPMKGKVLSG